MSEPGVLIFLVILTVIAAILLNLLLIASVRSSAKRTDAKTLRQMLKSVRSPFQSTDGDLDELAKLVENLKNQQQPPEKPTNNRMSNL